MPVSWQIGPVSSTAMSTLDKIMSRAWEDWVPGISLPAAIAIAARTSGGRFVDVWVMSSNRLPARNSIAVSPKVGPTLYGLNLDLDFIKQTTTFSHKNGTRLSRLIPVARRGIGSLHPFADSANLYLRCIQTATFGPKIERWG